MIFAAASEAASRILTAMPPGGPVKALIVLIVAIFAVGTAPLHAQDASEETFLELEREWTAALAERDSMRLVQLLSPEFTLLGAGATPDRGVVDRELYLRNSMRFDWPRREVRIVDLRTHENVAVVRCVWQGPEPPPFPTDDPDAELFGFYLTDIWVHGDDGWRVLARHSSFL